MVGYELFSRIQEDIGKLSSTAVSAISRGRVKALYRKARALGQRDLGR
jgi:hypothetical protein